MGFERIIEIALEFIYWFQFWFVLDEYEKGVVLQLGKFRREVGPGFWFCLPFGIDQVLQENFTFRTARLRTQTLTTKDLKTVVVSPVVAYRIKHIKKFLLEVESAEDALKDVTYGTMGEKIRSAHFLDMMTDEWHDELYKEVREQGFIFGIEVLSVRLSDFGEIFTARLINSNDYEGDYDETD